MNTRLRLPRLQRRLLLTTLCASLPLAAVFAQTAPASSASSMRPATDMHMSDMLGMAMSPAASTIVPTKPQAEPAQAPVPAPASAASSDSMPGMAMPSPAPAGPPAVVPPSAPPREASPPASTTRDSMPGMDSASMPGMPMAHGSRSASPPAPAYPAPPPQGSTASMDAAMDMADDRSYGQVLFNQLEATHAAAGNGQAWEAQAWYGGDFNRLLLRSEGDRSGGRIQSADAEALWSHPYAAFWNTELGVRRDFGVGPGRSWAAFGVQGIAPYWFNIEATGYVGSGQRTAARLKVEYELLITQRLILQPEFEANLYGRSDPARRIGSGLSDASLGLRLRYEIRRQFAPYIGVVWVRRMGTTATYARQDHQPVFEPQLVAGLRLWF